MCQIMTIQTTGSGLDVILEERHHDIAQTLNKKGGDYFSLLISSHDDIFKSKSFEDMEDFSNYLTDDLPEEIKDKYLSDEKIIMTFFSRQAPEMEIEGAVREQPYINPDKSVVAIHGTIYNDEELASRRGLKINVDTEVFTFMNFWDQTIKGTFTAIMVDKDLNVQVRDHGLGYWTSSMLSVDGINIGDVCCTTEIDFSDQDLVHHIKKNHSMRTLQAAFSGGMDIALSVYEALSTGNYDNVKLNYFDWGSNANASEITAIENLAEFYQKEFGIPVQMEYIAGQIYFEEFFKMLEAEVKIADAEAKGDSKETEAPIAYVPYRNTQFAMILAALAEQEGLKHVDILFGLNLSEGMVFMDNAEPWLKSISNVVKYGGSDFSVSGTYNVIAPYFQRTKTNMLKEFKEKHGTEKLVNILDKSFSCYYPKEGKACGECGSCILREKAILRTFK